MTSTRELKEIIPPIIIQYIWLEDNRGQVVRRATIVSKKGRNLETDEGDWLWWATLIQYGPVEIIADPSTAPKNSPASLT